ncbi:phosphatase PAP2 family protein [Faecalicatena contorta]|uniref:PAP2 superfamily protein n=1 Tax=Faecalicatena contorta TaxID=39482 RepID=A0A315ZV51_9FIRM|nr:phosphatase PAP2 family protein [Faecalicatena contorta]PWJ49476.1 PAP2 superfamily protein [Faecalicatena contorta]SUQ14720.1 PAP2 superfamily protein [Faecalicatena contorta]
MSLKNKAAGFIKKYKHAWVFSYILIYMPWFLYLEKHVTSNYHVIHSSIDKKIPFIEYFIVPYLLWFVFIAITFLYFFFTDVEGFYKLAKLMFTGMTIFLIISTLIPNGVNLRPVYFDRNNIFIDMVKMLYRADTPTNVLPSLHVFNSIAACIAICHSQALRKHKIISWSAYILAGLIILATMFLKQHSVIDVMAGALMSYALYQFVYETNKKRVPKPAGEIAF